MVKDLFDDSVEVDEKVVNLLSSIKQFEPACYVNMKEVFLSSNTFKKYICEIIGGPEKFTRNKIKKIMQ